MRHLRLFACAMLAVTTLPAQAEHDIYLTSDNYRFEQLEPVNLVDPPRPRSRTGPGPESWAKIRFTIQADGSVADIDVLDAMPPTASLRDTVDAVEAWRFQPAMVDGEAVDWHNNIVVVNIDLPEIPNLSGPRFMTPYGTVQDMLAEGKLDRAARQAADNLRDASLTLHDLGVGNVQLAVIEMRRQDMYLAHQAITRATLPEVNQLGDEELDVALQYRFNIELALGRFMDALDTYERRAALVDIDDDDRMLQQVRQITEALDQDYVLQAKASILDKDTGWFFIPSRRTFSIADVDGDLKSIDVVCNRNIASLDFQEGVEWTLPESWGDCTLNVMGNRNTTFTFYEFSD